jgi:hypothetical protein
MLGTFAICGRLDRLGRLGNFGSLGKFVNVGVKSTDGGFLAGGKVVHNLVQEVSEFGSDRHNGRLVVSGIR